MTDWKGLLVRTAAVSALGFVVEVSYTSAMAIGGGIVWIYAEIRRVKAESRARDLAAESKRRIEEIQAESRAWVEALEHANANTKLNAEGVRNLSLAMLEERNVIQPNTVEP